MYFILLFVFGVSGIEGNLFESLLKYRSPLLQQTPDQSYAAPTIPDTISGPELIYWLTRLSRNPETIKTLIANYEELVQILEDTTEKQKLLREHIDVLQSGYCPEGSKEFEGKCISLLKKQFMSFYEAKITCIEKGGQLASVPLHDLNSLLDALDVGLDYDLAFYIDLAERNGDFYLTNGKKTELDTSLQPQFGTPKPSYETNCYQLAFWPQKRVLQATTCYFLATKQTPVSYAVCEYPKIKPTYKVDYNAW